MLPKGDFMSTIKLIKASCVDQEVDAIVNAANRDLQAGGGVCGAIFCRAGYAKLQEACNKIKTPLEDGEVAITPAFDISNAKYIIHAVGPDFGYTPTAFDKLFNAYYNSMKVLIENNLHSIAFPLISSGIYGGSLENPAGESAEQCVMAYKKILKDYNDYDIDVILCAFTEEEYERARKVIGE
jgi:O-acetyl-ADP-ribose deacetylase (regulator of RNase III)